MPNIGSLLRKDVDILQLDVGSLKEGQWKEGDDETMKIVRMEWMDWWSSLSISSDMKI